MSSVGSKRMGFVYDDWGLGMKKISFNYIIYPNINMEQGNNGFE